MRRAGLLGCLALAWLACAPQAGAQAWLSVEELGARLDKPPREVSCGSLGAGFWFSGYRASFSRARGPACNFEPSCSHFSQESIERYGLLQGLLMTGDRLERCNQCLGPRQYPRGRGGPDSRILDPVEDDDVRWWFAGGHPDGWQHWREGLLHAPR